MYFTWPLPVTLMRVYELPPHFYPHVSSRCNRECVSVCVTTLLDEQTDIPEIQHVGQVKGYLSQVQRSRSPGQETF